MLWALDSSSLPLQTLGQGYEKIIPPSPTRQGALAAGARAESGPGPFPCGLSKAQELCWHCLAGCRVPRCPRTIPLCFGGWYPGSCSWGPPVPGTWGHLGTNTAGTVCCLWCHCQAQGGWKAGWWHQCHSPQAVYHARGFKGSAEVKFHPAPAATASHMGTALAQAPWEQSCHHCPHPHLQAHSSGSSPWCWDGHRHTRVSLNLAGILPMTSAQWRLLIILFAEII